jgi:hypothetical protein
MANEREIINELREIRGLLNVLVEHLPPAALAEANRVFLERQFQEACAMAPVNPKPLQEFLAENPGWMKQRAKQ